MLAEFANKTGDSVFDGLSTLRQGLSTQLEQSPFLNLLSDDRIGRTLALMEQPKGTRLTHELAREVCQGTASAGVLAGTIAASTRPGVEIGKVIGRMHLALDNREDLDLIEPTG